MGLSARSHSLALALLVLLGGCDEMRARRNIQNGNKAYYDSQYEEAVGHYEEALKLRPQLTVGWYNLGLSHLAVFAPGQKTPANEAHAEGAIQAFKEYLTRRPGDTTAVDYLLSTYIDSGRYEGALEYFENKLAKNPADIQAVAQLAQINTQAMRYDDANKWHRKRAEIELTSEAKADAWYSMGVLAWRRLHYGPDIMGAERARIADEGVAALQQADQLRPSHQATLIYINLLYRERALAHDAFCARVVELTTAQLLHKRAMAVAREAKERAEAQLRQGQSPEAAPPENKQ